MQSKIKRYHHGQENATLPPFEYPNQLIARRIVELNSSYAALLL
jgi:hypothetical protein